MAVCTYRVRPLFYEWRDKRVDNESHAVFINIFRDL
jgi:hypothetical protein